MSDIKLKTKGYNQEDDLERVINYALREREEDVEWVWWTGLGVGTDSAEEVIHDMRLVKQVYGKTDGKQLWQLIISIKRYQHVRSKEDYNHKKEDEAIYCRLIGMEICNLIYNEGFQNIVAMHTDTENYHLHFVINSINIATGNHIRCAYTFEKKIGDYLKDNYRNLQWNCNYER